MTLRRYLRSNSPQFFTYIFKISDCDSFYYTVEIILRSDSLNRGDTAVSSFL